MHAQAEQLAEQFKKDFFAADHTVKWTAAEQTLTRWLSPNTVLVGTIDAQGITEAGEKFFADWKTIGVRAAGKNNSQMAMVKSEWRLDPQALSYGVLMGDDCRQFTVRWAVKTTPVVTDYEWYTYTSAELDWWKGEVLSIADDIRMRRFDNAQPNWPTNLKNCTRYGWNFRCPLYDNGCTKLDFTSRPDGIAPRDHHLELEESLRTEYIGKGGNPAELVVLSSSSIEMFLGCQEKYRRFYEGEGMSESGDALQIGTDFHLSIKDHIQSLIAQ